MLPLARRIHDGVERRRYRWFNQRAVDIALKPGMVSFTFDDFPSTAATNGAALLETRGYRGTFYLSTGILDSKSNLGRICSLGEVNKLYLAGHEIGAHTHSHLCCQSVSKVQLSREVNSSLRMLEQFGKGRNFALPFGAYDDSALNCLSGHFDTIRTIFGGINSGKSDLNLLKANSIYQTTNLDRLQSLVDKVRETGGWLIFYTHDVCPLPSEFGCTPDRFDAILDMVKKADLEVNTVASTYRHLTDATG